MPGNPQSAKGASATGVKRLPVEMGVLARVPCGLAVGSSDDESLEKDMGIPEKEAALPR